MMITPAALPNTNGTVAENPYRLEIPNSATLPAPGVKEIETANNRNAANN
jgi:hypothetical protein